MSLGNLLKSSLLFDASIYGALNFARQLIPFLLLPILTRYLTPSDYGILSIFTIVVSMLSLAIGLNTDGSVGREFFERAKIDFPSHVVTCATISTVCFVILLFATPLLGSVSESWVGVPGAFLWVAVTIAFARYFTQLLLVIYQSSMKPLSYGIYALAQTIVEVCVTLVLVVIYGQGLEGRIAALFVVTICSAGIAIYLLHQGGWLAGRFKLKSAHLALAFGVPLIPHVVGGMAISFADRLLLVSLLGEAPTGLYFLGFQIGSVVAVGASAYNSAWAPWLFSRLGTDDPNARRAIVKATYTSFVAILMLVAIVQLLAPFLFHYVIDEKFHEGLQVAQWTAIGCGFLGMYYIVGAYITFARRTHLLALVTFVVGCFNVVASYFMIKQNGFLGAAQAGAAAHLFSFAFTWVLVSRTISMPWSLRSADE